MKEKRIMQVGIVVQGLEKSVKQYNDFFGAGYHFVIDKRGAYMCYVQNFISSRLFSISFLIILLNILFFLRSAGILIV